MCYFFEFYSIKMARKFPYILLFLGVPGTYSFGYDVSDADSGNTQFRNEERYPNGTVVGSYGYIDPSGKPVRYKYIADERGYRFVFSLS